MPHFMQKKLYYTGLYGDNSIEFVRGLIHVYPFGVIGKKFNNKVRLHAHHNLFQIFIIEKGTTEIQYNEQKYEISAPAFITIPKNVLHGFNHKEDVSGWIITLSDIIVEQLLQPEATVIFEMDVIHITSLDPNKSNLVEVYQTMKKCILEYQNNLTGKLLMLQSLVSQLMVQLFRLTEENLKNIAESDNMSKIYFRRFLQHIKTSYSFKKTVESYAKDLNISTGHLNRICQTVTNQSPKDVIIDYFIAEAQLLLTHIDKTITEVAYELDFEDPSYFARLFKQKMRCTPKAFREKQGRMI
jgi:AraC family transcriptional regulator, transcriptional activator of pobA